MTRDWNSKEWKKTGGNLARMIDLVFLLCLLAMLSLTPANRQEKNETTVPKPKPACAEKDVKNCEAANPTAKQ